jgi:tetratricopeptide (TPR) repeat protein
MDQHSLEQDLAVVRGALETGDLEHAAHHLAGAVGEDPLHPEVSRALIAFQEAAGARALELVPMEGEIFHGLAALRAWLLCAAGQHDEALSLLLQAQAAVPTVPYAGWLERWLGQPSFLHAIAPDGLASHAEMVLQAAPPERPGDAADTVARVLAALQRAQEAHPASARLFFVTCRSLRRAGRLDEALQLAELRRRTRPDYFTFIAMASVQREQGKLAAAVDSFRGALEHEPEDVGARLDIGDLTLELGRLDQALAAYQEAIALEPGEPWAQPSALLVRHRLGEAGARDALIAFAAEHPDNERARSLLEELEPYVLSLPRRPESLVNMAAQVAELEPGAGIESLALSSLEAPSAVAAFRSALLDAKVEGGCAISIGEIPEPDPREPLRPVSVQLWSYGLGPVGGGKAEHRSTEARPAVAAPPAEVAAALAALAREPYRLERWWEQAGALGAAQASRAEAVLACMVHPPPHPDELTPWDWMFRVQVAAALVIARLPGAWPGQRRELLFSLALGPTDWTSTAALIALTELAVREPEARGDIKTLVADLLGVPSSPIRFMCIESPLAHLLPRIPDLPPAVLAQARAFFEELRR